MNNVLNGHLGHRERMREKAVKHGFNSFHSHEILEMILYSSITRKDTNELAHELINTFGSFSAVLDASYDDLLKVDGVGESTAFMLKLLPATASLYLGDKFSNGLVINTREQASEYLKVKYIDQTEEMPSALFLNSKGKLLGWSQIGDGSIKSAEIIIRRLVELCIRYQAAQVILCHNHPSGITSPSKDDILTTRNIISTLKTIDVSVVDHIIVSGNNYFSMSSSKEFELLFN